MKIIKLLVFQITPNPVDYYGSDNLKNGFFRPFGGANLWRSQSIKERPQQVVLNFNTPVEFNCVHLVFNTNLNHKRLRPVINTMEPTLVKKYIISSFLNGQEVVLREEKENYKRFVVHKFQKTTADRIVLTVYETYGQDHAELFDIRVYLK